VEAAVSSHFELPLDEDEISSHKPLSVSDKDEIVEKEQQEIAGGMASRTISALTDADKTEDVFPSGDNLALSLHSKSPGFREALSKPSSFRSLKRRSGGNGAEPSVMSRPEPESRPGFGRDFLARATSMRNMLQINGVDNLLGRSEHGTGGDAVVINKDEPIADLVRTYFFGLKRNSRKDSNRDFAVPGSHCHVCRYFGIHRLEFHTRTVASVQIGEFIVATVVMFAYGSSISRADCSWKRYTGALIAWHESEKCSRLKQLGIVTWL
jgi:hypothetical protein